MPRTFSHRLATLACIVSALAASLVVAHVSTTPTDAAPLRDLTYQDFKQVAQQGFGDPLNSYAWGMGWFKNKLYVGVGRDMYCAERAAANARNPSVSYPPPPDPDLAVPCDPIPQNLPLAGEIWALDPTGAAPLTQTNWTEVYQSPYTATARISNTNATTMAPRDMAFREISVYTGDVGGPAMYVSGVGMAPIDGPTMPPPSLLRTSDGTTFQAVPADPGTTLGRINNLLALPNACCFRTQTSYNGLFYVTITGYAGAGSLFVSGQPSSGDNSFRQVTPPAIPVFEMATFNGHLYLGVPSPGGYEVMRANCTVPPPGQAWCPPSSFTSIVPPGGGLGASGSLDVTSMHVFTDTSGVPHLYVGTDGTENHVGAEIIRINPDESWDLIVGDARTLPDGTVKTPLSTLTAGFGWLFNQHMWRMADYQGVLYVGTLDVSNAFKDTPLGPVLRPYMGFDLWASTDGVSFTPVTLTGFGDYLSFGARTLQATPYGLFLGSENWDKGLRIWQGSLSSEALRLAARRLRINQLGDHGTIMLSWDAPATAAQFRVYRASTRNVRLPASLCLAHDRPITDASTTCDIALPEAYTQIGATATSPFIDHAANSDGQYRCYYVVSQDGQGDLSAPSAVACTGHQARSSVAPPAPYEALMTP